MKSLLSILCATLLMIGSGHSQVPPKNYKWNLEILLDSLSIPEERIHIEIDKSDYILSIMADTLVIKQYPIVLGGNPKSDKFRQGDSCTPEGNFKVRTKYPHRSWNKFIWIDYPNESSWVKHNNAKKMGIIENEAGIGGEIGIHGVPQGRDDLIDQGYNWTLGCISLKNKDINDFYPYISALTLVIINQ
ncbi:murein L,D-transpeptidase family protein [Bacteroidota bacterium]